MSSPEELEQRIIGISFMSVYEVPGIVELTRTPTGWTRTEFLTDDIDDHFQTGEVEVTELLGALHPQLDSTWPEMIGSVDIEGLEPAEAISYVASARIGEIVHGGEITINGIGCEPDGDALVSDG